MSQNNALVEIALALAMAFFSIMVLAMVSMGVPDSSRQKKKVLENDFKSGIKLYPSTQTRQKADQGSVHGELAKKNLIVYYQEKFFDAELQEIQENKLVELDIKAVAVDPSIPTSEAIKIREIFGSRPVVVTLLNKIWLQRLKEKTNERT